jgi:hypothetical protein
MKTKLVMAAALVAGGMAFAATPSSAVPANGPVIGDLAGTLNAVQDVRWVCVRRGWRGYCRSWRWVRGGSRFFRRRY